MENGYSNEKELEKLKQDIKRYRKIIKDLKRNNFEEEYLLLRKKYKELARKLSQKEEMFYLMEQEKEELESTIHSQQENLTNLTETSIEIKELIQNLKKQIDYTMKELKIFSEYKIEMKSNVDTIQTATEELKRIQGFLDFENKQFLERSEQVEDISSEPVPPTKNKQMNRQNPFQGPVTFRTLQKADLSSPIYYKADKGKKFTKPQKLTKTSLIESMSPPKPFEEIKEVAEDTKEIVENEVKMPIETPPVEIIKNESIEEETKPFFPFFWRKKKYE